MLKKIISTFLVCAMACSPVVASANAVLSEDMEVKLVQLQAEAIIEGIDEEALLMDALDDVIDYSVPEEIRESIIADATFMPAEGVSQDEVEVEVHSTVQKVGEVLRRSGDVSNMYVSVVSAEIKEDSWMTLESGVRAWAIVCWIDNFGFDNVLYSAKASWDPGNKSIQNRVVKYGVTGAMGLTWTDGPTIQYPTENIVEYVVDEGTYVGYKLKCQTEVEIVNVGILTCSSTSGWTT